MGQGEAGNKNQHGNQGVFVSAGNLNNQVGQNQTNAVQRRHIDCGAGRMPEQRPGTEQTKKHQKVVLHIAQQRPETNLPGA